MKGSIIVGEHQFVIKDCGHLVWSKLNNPMLAICDACHEIKKLKERLGNE